MPSSTDLPTPEPAKSPMRCPPPTASSALIDLTPTSSGSRIARRMRGFKGSPASDTRSVHLSSPKPSKGRPAPSSTRPSNSSPIAIDDTLCVGMTRAPGDIRGVMPGARVIPTHSVSSVAVGDELLGRVLDGAGRPLDGFGDLKCTDRVSLTGEPLNPLMRRAIRDPLDVGVRSINALLSVGGGQRIGLFAGSGVGKSVLVGMMTRYTKADVTVVGLIGERGREVQDFVSNTLGPDGMRRAVVIATPADTPPLMRVHGAWLATAIAEYFRDRGLKVLLLLDSLTRFAQAQREIALAIGEPPATKGYPPSVFARLPQLVERAGNSDRGSGSITADRKS